jgi:hypothetical protein
MYLEHPVLIALFVAAATASGISNVIFYQIFREINSGRTPDRRFTHMAMNLRFFEIIAEHARLFPDSRKRSLMHTWHVCTFALLLALLVAVFALRRTTGQ